MPFVKSTEASKPVSIPTFGRIDQQHEKVRNVREIFGLTERSETD